MTKDELVEIKEPSSPEFGSFESKNLAWETKGKQFFEELENWIYSTGSRTSDKNFICEFIQPFSEMIYYRAGKLGADTLIFETGGFTPLMKEDFLCFKHKHELDTMKDRGDYRILMLEEPNRRDNYFSNFIYADQIKENGGYNLVCEVFDYSHWKEWFLEGINVKASDLEGEFKIRREIVRGVPNGDDPIETLTFRLLPHGKAKRLGEDSDTYGKVTYCFAWEDRYNPNKINDLVVKYFTDKI